MAGRGPRKVLSGSENFVGQSCVAFGGSRVLAGGRAASLVASVVARAVARGWRLRVGCAPGADALAVAAALAHGGASRLSLFCVGGSCGAGFPRQGGVPAWVRGAAGAGARVRWWAGGTAPVPLRARLALRARACVASASSTVFFVNSAFSRGSWGAAAHAAALGVPVFFFPIGVSPAALVPLPRQHGAWQQAARAGLWAQALRWVPAP